jgi:hypothetical protein
VPIQQLDDSRRLAERRGTLDRLGPVEGVDEPDLALGREGM